jgi:hypothetical protein
LPPITERLTHPSSHVIIGSSWKRPAQLFIGTKRVLLHSRSPHTHTHTVCVSLISEEEEGGPFTLSSSVRVRLSLSPLTHPHTCVCLSSRKKKKGVRLLSLSTHTLSFVFQKQSVANWNDLEITTKKLLRKEKTSSKIFSLTVKNIHCKK